MRTYQDHIDALSHHKGLRKMINAPGQPLGHSLSAGPTEAELSLLLDRLVPVLSDSGARKRIETLRQAAADHRTAHEQLVAARRDFEVYQKKQIADLEAQQHARTVALDERETSHHDAVAAFHNEQAVERKRLAEMTSAAERDRAQAGDLLERAKRKIAAFEAN
jgi:hypothetical protein